ncbi:NADPH:quinone reductase [Marivirga tractuosa]|uniref:Alcohol dehydrogenase zinc-binding domain protein n=1 Tax=Marivirga tractuosa (strain ATCC 23168 / DSM 4126 / NBRC 15989 / NCIMB 1408 / VKM B-1430 / H-43) TaxID=643867 RepID=E4TP63_MARTH|nr:NADP-dependent oxidoreductase [Marivirga tractuosa]ADR20466.1 Alcohol dehydrogenase zinc-binding domain protein [Marivirga tractuosa DSM 4126]BDD15089.1 NADPH:quinone reductase [Marivirga tractuosa]
MKALKITGYGEIAKNVDIKEIENPKVGDNQVLIEVYAASINPIDYKIIEGAMKNIRSLSFPAPIGFDVAGKVVDKGEKVNDFNLGDEVFARVPTDSPGTFAEMIAVDQKAVCQKPAAMTFVEAASIPLVGLTTVQVFQKSDLKSGDKVLIHAGSGGVGSFAIQYAKAQGAYVYTTTSTKNVDWVKDLGADQVIDYKKEDYLNIIEDVDVVYDTLGGDYTKDAFKILKKGGKVISIAGDPDNETAKELGLNGLIRFLLKLKRFKIDQLAKEKNALYKFVMMHADGSQLNDIKDLIENKNIAAVVDKEFPFSEAVSALEYVQKGHAKGKVVLNMK